MAVTDTSAHLPPLTAADPISNFRREWAKYIQRESDRGRISPNMPRMIQTPIVPELLHLLMVLPSHERYAYGLATRLSTTFPGPPYPEARTLLPNLIRRLAKWEDYGLTLTTKEDPLIYRSTTREQSRARAKRRGVRRYYGLTEDGRRLGRLASGARSSPGYPVWHAQLLDTSRSYGHP